MLQISRHLGPAFSGFKPRVLPRSRSFCYSPFGRPTGDFVPQPHPLSQLFFRERVSK